jgi:Integrase repeat unit
VRSLGLKSQDEWGNYCRSGKKPNDIPVHPDRTYAKDGWSSWGDWFGTGFVARQLRKYRPFRKARAYVRHLGLTSRTEWDQYCKSGKKPADIPANPASVYAKEGWTSLGNWLGTGRIAGRLRKYRPFKKARAFVRRLGLKSTDEWYAYARSGRKPADIPTKPSDTYAKLGWSGIRDWLGTAWRPFKPARSFVQRLGLNSAIEWRGYCKCGKKPIDIPVHPDRTYAEDGWSSMGDWLGTGRIADRLRQYRSFKKARVFARSLGLKSQVEWDEYCKSGKKPEDIPSVPSNTYRDAGWTDWYDWLGTSRIPNHRRLRDLSIKRGSVSDSRQLSA